MIDTQASSAAMASVPDELEGYAGSQVGGTGTYRLREIECVTVIACNFNKRRWDLGWALSR